LREILEAGEMELSLDTVQPKLMQREQTIKLKAESKTAHAEVVEEGQAAAFLAKQRYWGSSGAGKESSRELRANSDTRSCYGCGETGHIKLNCRFRHADRENCGRRGHTRAVCRQPAEKSERAAYAKGNACVAYTAWRSSAVGQPSVWLVDSGSTQHITADKSRFTSYIKLKQPELIEGIGGEPLTAIGVVELHCKPSNGVGMVTLREVRHVPKARANLFALRRATDAGSKITIEGRLATFETNGVVCMEAKKKNGLVGDSNHGRKAKST
jgi:hypothetical protein